MKAEDVKKTPINKRSVFIEVPDRDEDNHKFKIPRTNDVYTNSYEEDRFK